MTDFHDMLKLSDVEFRNLDPLMMNLSVARSIPCLSDLDIQKFTLLLDEWANSIRGQLHGAEKEFRKTPTHWMNDINFFRLGVLCGFLEFEAGIVYKESQQQARSVLYSDPSDLFLNGVIDTRRGTCGNMATLHVALGWRLGWPVSLACVGSHFVCRYDDGEVTHNIEATQSGYGGFRSDPDEYLVKKYELPPVAITSGSDLRALHPREMLGVFLGFRGRHMRDTGRVQEAEADYLLARRLYPTSRRLYIDSLALVIPRGVTLFEPGEVGSPDALAALIRESGCSSVSLSPTGRLVQRDGFGARESS